jgi:hypothetical protein
LVQGETTLCWLIVVFNVYRCYVAVINFFLFAAKTSKVDPIDENVAVKK